MDNELNKTSKYLSFILRHKPDDINLTLDANGWASISELITKTTSHTLTPETINIAVETSDKQRFAIDPQNNKIRANQGHSIEVDLNLEPCEPPEFLLHGTADKFEASILKQGLTKQKRHHVHLSELASVAISVGQRYGKPIVFEIATQPMLEQGYTFYKTVNSVWLVEEVPAKYLIKT